MWSPTTGMIAADSEGSCDLAAGIKFLLIMSMARWLTAIRHRHIASGAYLMLQPVCLLLLFYPF